MPEQHGESGDHHPRGAIAGDMTREPHCCYTFHGVENQRENSRQRAHDTRDVGRPDVPAAGLAHVSAPKQSCEEQSEGNRAKKIRGERD